MFRFTSVWSFNLQWSYIEGLVVHKDLLQKMEQVDFCLGLLCLFVLLSIGRQISGRQNLTTFFGVVDLLEPVEIEEREL
jgi:hypothetical protein